MIVYQLFTRVYCWRGKRVTRSTRCKKKKVSKSLELCPAEFCLCPLSLLWVPLLCLYSKGTLIFLPSRLLAATLLKMIFKQNIKSDVTGPTISGIWYESPDEIGHIQLDIMHGPQTSINFRNYDLLVKFHNIITK